MKMYNLDEENTECTVGNKEFCFGTVRKPRMLCFYFWSRDSRQLFISDSWFCQFQITRLFMFFIKFLPRACDPASQVFEPIRVMVANRLANNAKEWTEIVARYRLCHKTELFYRISCHPHLLFILETMRKIYLFDLKSFAALRLSINFTSQIFAYY